MEIPYVPEHWQNLTLEFTDEYKLRKKKKIIRIEKLNDVSKSPKIMDKASRRSVNELKKPSKKYKYEQKSNKVHCVIL